MSLLEAKSSKAYETFINGLQSKETKKSYTKSLKKFLQFAKAQNPDELITRLSPTLNEFDKKRAVESFLKDWIIAMKNKGGDISANSIRLHIHAVASFYTINDVVEQINFKKIFRFLPENHKPIKDRAYTIEEISKMLETADERMKVIILLLESTGMRKGALPDLKLCDLEPIEDFYKITVYAGYDEEYETYCTPECRHAIDSYLEFRQRNGEKITKSSPLLRERFDWKQEKAASKPVSINSNMIDGLLWRFVHKTGIKQKPQIASHHRWSGHKRTELYLAHGFRKFFKTRCEMAGVKPIAIEELMGHTTGLAGKYFRPTDNEKLQEYKKAINDLTISEENKLRLQVKEEKTNSQRQLEKLTAEIDSIKEAMAKVIAKGELKPL
jgi:integrase